MRYLFLILTFNLFTGNFLKSQILNDSLINAYLILEDEGSAKQILNFKIKDQTNSPETMNSLLFQKGIIYMKTGQVDSALSNFNSVFLNTYKTKSTELFFQSFQKVLELNDLKSDTISIRKTIEIFIHVDLTDTSSLWYFYSVFWQKKLSEILGMKIEPTSALTIAGLVQYLQKNPKEQEKDAGI